MKDHSIYVDQDRYDTSIVDKYLDTVTVNTSTQFYKNTFPSGIIFTKSDSYTSDDQVGKLTREFNIHYRSCIVSLVDFLSTRVDLSFSVQKLANFSSNPGKVHFEGLVHLLSYIKDNNTLGLKYYADMKYSPLSDLLRQSNIKTENQLMVFYDSSWQDCSDTGRSTVAYIIFYQCGTIDHFTHVPGPFDQSSAKSEYNAACTAVMDLAHFNMLIHELLNKDPDIVPDKGQ